jgi:hypothetical protein
MSATTNDNSSANNTGNVNTPRVIKSEIPASPDNTRAITTNKYTRDVKPVDAYGTNRRPESYSTDKNRTNIQPANPNDTRINNSGKTGTGISVPNNNQRNNFSPPRNTNPNDFRNTNPNENRKGGTNIRMNENKGIDNMSPRVSPPANPGRNHGGGSKNEYRNQPSYNRGSTPPSNIRDNNHHSAPPVRNNAPSISAPSRGGGGAVSPAPVSPGNIGGGGGGNRIR